MADKVTFSNSGSGSLGIIAGVLAIVLVGLGLMFFTDVFDGGNKTMDVNLDAPKIERKVNVPNVGEGN